MPAVRDAVTPTELEERIFKTLKAAAANMSTPVTLRCAGGWVRDKLLGLDTDSPDIDVALDTLTGAAFGEALQAHLRQSCDEVSRSVIIESNPEQSKHLETARIKVHGVSLDLVNLRSETYTEDSRIPGSIQFGTPEQDAMRRDLTINALFYNLDTRSVEDFTGRGVDDLRAGVIRTPLAPRETFMDDPLRVLRAIRFAARFGFELDGALMEAAALPEVREALASKVSRERFGSELKGCLEGQDPVLAMQLVHQLRLFPTVFEPPKAQQAALGDGFGGPCIACMAAAAQLLSAWQPQEPLPAEDRKLALLAALLLPLSAKTEPPANATKKQKAAAGSAARHIVKESLKWPAKNYPEKVVTLHESAPEFAAIRTALQATGPAAAPAELRSRLGLAVRRAAGLWRAAAAMAPLLSLPATAPLGLEPGSSASSAASDAGADRSRGAAAASGGASNEPAGDGSADAALADRVACVSELEAAAKAFGVDRAWEVKPLLNGPQVMEAVGMKKAGPQLGRLTSALLAWQLGMPDATPEEARAWLAQQPLDS